MRALREAVDIRIAGGEMTRELSAFRDLVGARLPRRAAAGRGAGGRHHRPAPRRRYLAEAHGLVFTPHTWTNGMGVVANAHLVAGLG